MRLKLVRSHTIEAIGCVGAIFALVSPNALLASEAASETSSGANSEAATPLLSSIETTNSIEELRKRHLTFPISGFDVSRIRGSYNETRGSERHEASDILAPRGTEVLAVEDGTIAKLFLSRLGGITVYQFDPQKRYLYFYAHLERYAEGLKDGARVKRGEVIGYVGTSGDAPKDTPHLHFSISVPGPEKKWWQTAPLDPYLVFEK